MQWIDPYGTYWNLKGVTHVGDALVICRRSINKSVRNLSRVGSFKYLLRAGWVRIVQGMPCAYQVYSISDIPAATLRGIFNHARKNDCTFVQVDDYTHNFMELPVPPEVTLKNPTNLPFPTDPAIRNPPSTTQYSVVVTDYGTSVVLSILLPAAEAQRLGFGSKRTFVGQIDIVAIPAVDKSSWGVREIEVWDEAFDVQAQ